MERILNGFSPSEMATRNKIAELVEAKQFSEARSLSNTFIQANKKRSSQRRHLLKVTVKFWITMMNQKEH